MSIPYSDFARLTYEFETFIRLLRNSGSEPSESPFISERIRENMLTSMTNANSRYHLQEYVLDRVGLADFQRLTMFDFSMEDSVRFDELGLFGCMRHFKRSVINRMTVKKPDDERLVWLHSASNAQSMLRKEAFFDLVMHRSRTLALGDCAQRYFYASKATCNRWVRQVGSHTYYDRMPNISEILPLFCWRRTTGGILAIATGLSMMQRQLHWAGPTRRAYSFEDGIAVMRELLSDADVRYLSSHYCQRSQIKTYGQALKNGIGWALQSGVPPECVAHEWVGNIARATKSSTYIDDMSNEWRRIFSTFSTDVKTRIADYVVLFYPPDVAANAPLDYSGGVLDSVKHYQSDKPTLMSSLLTIQNQFPLHTSGGYPGFSKDTPWGLFQLDNARVWSMLYGQDHLAQRVANQDILQTDIDDILASST